MVAEDDRRLLDLIGHTYDAALDSSQWEGLAPRIARTFNSSSTALFILNTRDGSAPSLSTTANYTQQILDDYKAHYWQHDLWVNSAKQIAPARVCTSKDLVADKALERTEFCSDWLSKLDIFYIVGAFFPVSDGEFAIYGTHRPRSLGHYEQNDADAVAAFLPHLQRALQLRRRLAQPEIERSATLEALDRTGTATLVVAGNGRILYANPQAERLLCSGDAIRAVDGRLGTTDRASSQRLAALVGRVTETASGRGSAAGGAMAVSRGDRLPLTVLVAPFRPARNGVGSPVPAAILFIRDPEQSSLSKTALQELFGLTPAEACMATALASGISVEEFVASNRVSLNTARTHLKAVFAKTGTRRQAELVALILQTVSVLAPE